MFQVDAEIEIQRLKDRCMVLESLSNPSLTRDEAVVETSTVLNLDANDLIFLVGGYDGQSWLSALNVYSPSQDVLKSLRPMDSVRSYTSVAKLNGELYVFGGGNGHSWYDSGISSIYFFFSLSGSSLLLLLLPSF